MLSRCGIPSKGLRSDASPLLTATVALWKAEVELELPGARALAIQSGRYWARTSDPQLVELVLSQLS